MTIKSINILGTGVSAVNMPLALQVIDEWIKARTPHYVCVTGVHGVMESRSDETLRKIHNQAGMVTPDGMPLVWVSHLLGHRQVRRVCGPDFFPEVCRTSLEKGYRHFFYGGAPGVAEKLAASMRERFPGIEIVGTYCPPFRALTPEEDDAVVKMIQEARPDIVWVGISTPKQERWMAEHVNRLNVPVLVGVGAVFDFHSGLKKRAPRWMQTSGTEWIYRLVTDYKRLWKRYLKNNPRFVALATMQVLGLKRFSMD